MLKNPIENLISVFAKLPGLGPRSARRTVLHLIKNKNNIMRPLAENMLKAFEEIQECKVCRNIDITSPCAICADNKRESIAICIVEEVADLWAMERSQVFKGKYHVLGGVLSAIDGTGPEELGIPALVNRVEKEGVSEIIIATNATVEGQTTAHYINESLKDLEVKISRLAHGIPFGGELDYLDDGTLNAAMQARQYY